MFFQIAALGLMALFYGCYFGKMLAQHRQGIRTDQMGRGKEGRERQIEILLKLGSIAAPLTQLICIAKNITVLPEWLRICGIVIGALGVCAFYAAVLTMRDSWRAGVPEEDRTELVTGGVFQYSRNPAFLGFDLLYIGLLMLFFNPLLLFVTLVTVLLFHLQIEAVEEPFLKAAFGKAYEDYCRQVNRYIGRKQEKK